MSWLPAPVEEVFGDAATSEEAYDLLTVDVPAAAWTTALETARTTLGCTYFDWLSAVDEPGTGFRVCAHVAVVGPGTVHRLLLRTTVPHEAPVLASAVGVYAGAAWHERETHEMFGVDFTDHPGLDPLLLPDGFEGHPLRKDFVLAARVAKAWPGAKEPGESEHGGPKRRQMLPPGVPDPNDWGPMKGQLPPAPARPARGARAAGAGAGAGAAGRAAGAGAPGERPARRTRSVSEGSASQAAAAAPAASPAAPDAAPAAERPARPARRMRSVSEGSASQQAAPPARPEAEQPVRPEAEQPAPKPRTSDAPWHHAKPAFDENAKPASEPEPEREPKQESAPAPAESDTPEDPETTDGGTQ
ncbi:NADH-quinone oxidoreductase subunit C [Streptomyces sp. NPDC052225]|uniref:NADH-quinone oxidoreductase subunit C n=1 Tax=Streptomyces sp. NPDC052225 TaxID=3154949 RepID=UPI003428E339